MTRTTRSGKRAHGRGRILGVVLLALCASCATSESVKPGINDSYADNPSAVYWEGRLQADSREIWAHRERIVDAIGLFRGADVADIGAGAGFLARLMAPRVMGLGRVYAVELMPYFVDHLRATAAAEGLGNLSAVQCTERSVELPPHSIDIAFICDTYHHFEYPAETMGSVWRALRPGGRLVVIDFHRIPGVTRPWVLDHVRAGEQVVTREIVAAGFRLVGDADASRAPFLDENYILTFRKSL